MAKIAFFELEGWENEMLKKHLGSSDVYATGDILDAAHLPSYRDFELISVFVGSQVDRVVLDHFPDLRLVTTRSTGFDHIDLATCEERGITVAYVPGYGDNTVAEFTFGLLLCLTRKIYNAARRVKEEHSFVFEGLRGVDLQGKVFGVVGTGRIGRHVAAIARSFGMRVIAFDVVHDDAAAQALDFRYVSLEELLGEADVVSLHCLYNKSTHHLLNGGNMKLMKRGAFLLNTARGGIVETAALVSALESGALAGAGLDVLEEEETVKSGTPSEIAALNWRMARMVNVIITPHTAFNTQEAVGRIFRITLETIERFLAGEKINVIPR